MSSQSHSHKGATRKAGVEKRPFRLRIKHILVLVCLGGLMFVTGFLAEEVGKFFDRPLEDVRIKGDFTYINIEHMASLVEQQIVGGVLMTDLQHIQATLLAQPWVKEASVRRQWPDHLEVWLTERVPVAKFNDALLSSDINVFRPDTNSYSLSLPQLTGSPGSEVQIWEQYQWLQEALREDGLEVAALHREDRGAWDVTLRADSEVHLYFGRRDLELKIERFLVLYRNQLKERMGEIERIDLRYTHGVAVSWKQVKAPDQNT